MDIIVKGRHTYVPEAFRETVTEKLKKFETILPKAQAMEVEISHENNPKLVDQRIRVEITVISSGPIIRAEAANNEALTAFDSALEKLNERLRRARDKAKDHHFNRTLSAKGEGADSFDAAKLEAELKQEAQLAKTSAVLTDQPVTYADESILEALASIGETVEAKLGSSPVTVRKKVHAAEKLSVAEAIERMELVGHDFYAFMHESTGRMAVAYRRHGWKYGIIELA
ncbi:MAG: ribosome-associated translation inhibitor RaiA [Candidatus Ancillula sp.]|jgi:ribosomal subunit interface protein|nr:ribosome-associated translation inhibitor RaiA [Candidatus Ancillula sp.]